MQSNQPDALHLLLLLLSLAPEPGVRDDSEFPITRATSRKTKAPSQTSLNDAQSAARNARL